MKYHANKLFVLAVAATTLGVALCHENHQQERKLRGNTIPVRDLRGQSSQQNNGPTTPGRNRDDSSRASYVRGNIDDSGASPGVRDNASPFAPVTGGTSPMRVPDAPGRGYLRATGADSDVDPSMQEGSNTDPLKASGGAPADPNMQEETNPLASENGDGFSPNMQEENNINPLRPDAATGGYTPNMQEDNNINPLATENEDGFTPNMTGDNNMNPLVPTGVEGFTPNMQEEDNATPLQVVPGGTPNMQEGDNATPYLPNGGDGDVRDFPNLVGMEETDTEPEVPGILLPEIPEPEVPDVPVRETPQRPQSNRQGSQERRRRRNIFQRGQQ